MNRSVRRTIGALVAASALMLASACGGSTDSSSGSGAGGDADLVKTAAAKVAEFEKGADFPTLPEAFDPGTGKIAIIACGLAGPDCKNGAEAAQEAAQKMGWQADIFDAQFSAQRGSGFIDQAVQKGYDGIISISQPVETMKASVDNAIASGLTVVCAACFQVPGFDKVIFASVDWAGQGSQLAWSVINRSKGQAKVLLYDAPDQAVNARVKGFKETLTKECSSCKIVQSATIDATEIAKPGPPTFVADLAKNPAGTITDVVDPYDAIGVPMAKTIKQNGRTELTMSGYDATPEGVGGIIDGSLPINATMGLPRSFMSYAAVDLIARTKAGAPTYDVSSLPTILITKANAEKFVDSYYVPEEFPAAFLAAWGK